MRRLRDWARRMMARAVYRQGCVSNGRRSVYFHEVRPWARRLGFRRPVEPPRL